MFRFISAITALAWLYLLFVMVGVLFMEEYTLSDWLLSIGLIVIICCVIAASVYSMLKSTRVLPLFLLVASLVPGYVFARAMWRLQDPKGAHFLEIFRRGDYGWYRLTQDIIFIGLPLCWTVLCSGLLLRRRRSET